MQTLPLHEFHLARGAGFIEVNGAEAVASYGDWLAEHAALRARAGVFDLSCRGRVCLTGADRVRFLHGQVTNDIKALRVGQGCYAALVNAKGRMESDLTIYCLADELLLDFEPGFSATVVSRLEKFIVADDVQAVDVGNLYGLLSVQGPAAAAVLNGLGSSTTSPAQPFELTQFIHASLGEIYLANQPRLGTKGFDLFVPNASLGEVAQRLLKSADVVGGRLCGWQAFETARIEAGIPRFGADMDWTNFPQECGIEAKAVSYSKGCYLGQEVLNRIHTMGHVNRQLRALRFASELPTLPVRGDKLFHEGKEVGAISSAVISPALGTKIALAYVRREAGEFNTKLEVRTANGTAEAWVMKSPPEIPSSQSPPER